MNAASFRKLISVLTSLQALSRNLCVYPAFKKKQTKLTRSNWTGVWFSLYILHLINAHQCRLFLHTAVWNRVGSETKPRCSKIWTCSLAVRNRGLKRLLYRTHFWRWSEHSSVRQLVKGFCFKNKLCYSTLLYMPKRPAENDGRKIERLLKRLESLWHESFSH